MTDTIETHDVTIEKKALAIQSLIRKGRLDGFLPDIVDTIVRRRDVLAKRKFADIEVGDRVRMVDHVKPRYAAGAVGSVISKSQTRVTVQFDKPLGKFGTTPVKCPITILEIIE